MKKSRTLSASKLRDFRKSISTLKKQGLVSKKVDARKVQPTKHYRKLVSEFRGVIEGRARAIPIPKGKTNVLKELDYHVTRKRLIVDNFPGQRIIKDKDSVTGFRVLYPDRIEHLQLSGPKGAHIETYLNKIEKLANKLKHRGRVQYGFKFFGNNSRQSFSSIAQLKQYLIAYSSVQSAEGSRKRALIQEQIQNLEIYVMPTRTATKFTKRNPTKKLGRKKK